MKPVSIFVLLFFILSEGNAQHHSVKKPTEYLNLFKQYKSNQATGPKDSLLADSYVFNAPKMKLLFENKRGKVYESPIDHMRFLAPGFHSAMPRLIPDFHSTMPVYKIFPKGLLQNVKGKTDHF